uniref:Transposase IS4 family protein n=1 Tax=uncultured Verrucomicrobiota bacterium TaxID=156588 RepID=D2DXY0_9BACT|nr:transposase IS4 family protein [uncultured Verrucomicrobiota bacterium]
MPARFVSGDHDTPLLLPPDLRDWVPANHLVHFIMDAVGLLDVSAARVNQRGTGSAQYPPGMMLGLLIYCYATGTFSSRRIERLTYEHVAVRFLCADQHPDHDSICHFRRENGALLESSFGQVLECAARLKVLRVGEVTLALDGTKILANASRHSAVSHGHASAQMVLLEEQVQALLAKAEAADSTPLEDGLTIPEEVARRRERLEQLRTATAVMEARAKARAQEEQAAFEAKAAARAEQEKTTGKKARGRAPKPPEAAPNAKDQFNFTDPESRIMATKDGFQQSYNAQAAVEIESRLIVCQTVTAAANDKEQLVPTLATLSPVVESVAAVLVDSGFYSAAAVAAVEQGGSAEAPAGPTVYAATQREAHGRTVAQLEKHDDPPPPGPGASAQAHMQHRLATKAGRTLYRQRKQTIEPVFGIIKAAMGFRRFSLRGLVQVGTEWTLVALAYNLKRLFHLGAPLAAA